MGSFTHRLLSLFAFLFLVSATVFAGPTKYGRSGYGSTSVGIRLGWVGAPNGFSYRKSVAPGHAFEFVAGYNPKYGRHSSADFFHKGNTFLSLSYAPNLTMSENNLAVGIYGDFGVRMNLHHYRFSELNTAPVITPDLFAGLGIQIEFMEAVEVFGDMHVKYYSTPGNYFTPGVESGLGIRFRI